MTSSISQGLGQHLVKHQSVIENQKGHAKALYFAVGCGGKFLCASLSGMYLDHVGKSKPPAKLIKSLFRQRQHCLRTAKSQLSNVRTTNASFFGYMMS